MARWGLFGFSAPNIALSILRHHTAATLLMAIGQNDDVFVAVYLSPSSQYIQKPADLQARHSSIKHKGNVGELADVQLISVTKSDWESSQQQILGALQSAPGVTRVEVQQLKQRTKRVMDEY